MYCLLDSCKMCLVNLLELLFLLHALFNHQLPVQGSDPADMIALGR
jgi:hypothetical protein